MGKEFVWTDELVAEFTKGAIELQNKVPQDVSLYNGIYHFKKYHQPKEETVDKDWEIVSFDLGFGEIKQLSDKPGFFAWGNSSASPKTDFRIRIHTVDEMLKLYPDKIHSVKRLSTNETFKIGDELVKWGKIVSFKIQSGIFMLAECNDGLPEYVTVVLEDWKHKPKEQTNQTDRVEVNGFYESGGFMSNVNGESHRDYRFNTKDPIPKEKFPLIKQAIENCLNDPPPTPTFSSSERLFTKDEMEKCFDAAKSDREIIHIGGYDFTFVNEKYKTFDDYIKSTH